MPPKGAKKPKPVGLKDLAVYLAEIDENGVVPDDTISFVRQCVMDKIFAEIQDHIAICRTDQTSSVQVDAANWEALRKVEHKFRQPGKSAKYDDAITALLSICQTMVVQAKEDSYEYKKIVFFGLLKTDFKEDRLTELAKFIKKNKINVSMILPDEHAMGGRQMTNCELLRKFLECEEYEEFVYICTQSEAKKQIHNTLTKEVKRAMPWNVVLEIGSSIAMNVSGYVCTRKNTASALKKAFVKEEHEQHVPPPVPSSQSSGNNGALAIPSSSMMDEDVDTRMMEKKTVIVEFASDVTEKEAVWKEKNGEVVNDEDVGKGYFYGDKLIPFNELENEDTYQSGEKCFRVILFCPRANIFPAFQQGDGTTLFYAKKGDSVSAVKLSALRQALHNSERVAIARKVYRKGTRVVLGVLSPDMDRKCLVFSELCFADDVSVPHFVSLFKQQSTAEEDDGITLSAKEQLIDDLILSQPLDGFHPFEGPIDPSAASLRNSIASRILDPDSATKPSAIENDNIDTFFDKVVLRQLAIEGVKDAFPLKISQQQADRPAGADIFRKRPMEEEIVDNEPDKKPKLEDMEVGGEELVLVVEQSTNNDVDYDDLLDQM